MPSLSVGVAALFPSRNYMFPVVQLDYTELGEEGLAELQRRFLLFNANSPKQVVESHAQMKMRAAKVGSTYISDSYY
jgi:hypothetical protein